jgi:hypothetical protein
MVRPPSTVPMALAAAPGDAARPELGPHVGVESDARLLNWLFLVPDEPDTLLLLPVGSEEWQGALVADAGSLRALLDGGPYPAVAAPDLTGWAVRTGWGAARLLRRLAERVEPGGWLYAGFSNPLFPGRPFVRGSIRLRSALRVVKAAGLTEPQSYIPFPSATCPAYIVGAGAAELDYFLRRLAFPYADASTTPARLASRLLRPMLRIALAAPRRSRAGFAPAGAIVARRPS